MDGLLNSVRNRRRKLTEFGYGITTADRYVVTLQERLGIDGCYRYFARGNVSFDDLLRKAAQTLVYSNSDMVVEEKRTSSAADLDWKDLPKNTLMLFKHVLTSSRTDRDGDTLHSEGAELDPKMLLLWQHLHTMPIGRMVKVADRNQHLVRVYSVIVDMNDLCHDAAVMIDNGMGRFSHGFRAIEYEKAKNQPNGEEGGFDVRRFEIMEESLVSVPANVDAETEEILMGLVGKGKLTSPVMKEIGRSMRKKRRLQVPAIKYRERRGDLQREVICGSSAELKAVAEAGLIGGMRDEDEFGKAGRTGRGEKRPTGASEEADAEAENENETQRAKDSDMTDDRGSKPPHCAAEGESGNTSYRPPEGKPYPNEHACRLRNPDKYEKIRRENDAFGEGVHAIWGVTEDGDVELQAIRFDKDKFTADEALRWLEEHDYPTEGFEEASDASDGEKSDAAGNKQKAGNEQKADGDQEAGIIANIQELSGSWESTMRHLQNGLCAYLLENGIELGDQGWARVIGTFNDYVIASVHREGESESFYRIGWEMVERMPTLVGEPENVRVQVQSITEVTPVENEKAGRVISRANEQKIREALANLEEISADEDLPRSVLALVRDAVRELSEVLSALGPPEQSGSGKTFDSDTGLDDALSAFGFSEQSAVGRALAVLVARASRTERQRALKMLQFVEGIERCSDLIEHYTVEV